MKILMTVMMTLAMTSAMAGECKLGGECKVDADCKAVNKDYAVSGGKCVDPKANEKETQCAGIVSSAGAKPASDTATDAAAGGTKVDKR